MRMGHFDVPKKTVRDVRRSYQPRTINAALADDISSTRDTDRVILDAQTEHAVLTRLANRVWRCRFSSRLDSA